MKKIFLFLLCFSFVFSAALAEVRISGMGVYSEGSRMGMLSKFSPDKGFLSSGEGQLLMGSESGVYTVKKGDINITVNPWSFSSVDDSIKKQLANKVGQYVVVDYVQARVKKPRTSTEYEITSVKEIGKPIDEVCKARSYSKGLKSQDAVRTGRIVKASTKGTVSKSWEIMMQQGEGGNQFKNMSITDDIALYECARRYLAAGQRVKITYSESFTNIGNLGDRDTNTDIISIEPLKSGQNLN